MPLVVTPQLLLCGLFVPRSQMAGWLEGVSTMLPMTWSVMALTEVGSHSSATSTMWSSLAIVVATIMAALTLGALTLRRRTA